MVAFTIAAVAGAAISTAASAAGLAVTAGSLVATSTLGAFAINLGVNLAAGFVLHGVSRVLPPKPRCRS